MVVQQWSLSYQWVIRQQSIHWIIFNYFIASLQWKTDPVILFKLRLPSWILPVPSSHFKWNDASVFNLKLKSKMKSHQMPKPVVFWRWTAPSKLALITASAVYCWPISGDAPPTKKSIVMRYSPLMSGSSTIRFFLTKSGCFWEASAQAPMGKWIVTCSFTASKRTFLQPL